MPIAYTEKGSGHPLILVHGFCETKEIWDTLPDRLAQTFRVITVDLPGCGESTGAPANFSLEDIAQTMLEWIQGLRLHQAVLIGHSLGGYVTLAMARQQPDKFAAIGLFHSSAAPDAPEKKENRNKVIAFVQKHGVEPYTDSFVPGLFYDQGDEWIPKVRALAAKTSSETLTGYAAAMRDRLSSLEFIREFPKPILFLAGEHDGLIPPAVTTEQASTARHPVFEMLKGCAHMGMLENEPESRNRIENFMKLSLEKMGGRM